MMRRMLNNLGCTSLVAGFLLLFCAWAVLIPTLGPFVGGVTMGSVCPDGTVTDYELPLLPPSYICEYDDGSRVHMGLLHGWASLGLACGGVSLIVAAPIAWHRASRISRWM